MKLSFSSIIALLFYLFLYSGCSDQNFTLETTGENLLDTSAECHWRSLENEERVDSYFRVETSVFCGDSSSAIQPMQNIHFKTFEVCSGSAYARDSTNVYYPIEIVEFSVADTTIRHCRQYVVEGVRNPFHFRYLGRGYGTDNHNVFLRGILIEGI